MDGKIVTITLKFTNVIETGDYANIQVFNLLLRNCLRHLDLKLIGRNFYDPKAKVESMSRNYSHSTKYGWLSQESIRVLGGGGEGEKERE